MSDIKLFRFSQDKAEELAGRSALVERDLHDLMERHMECFLGIRFVAHEYSTGKNHRGRIDSLGLDENCCPVIIEYKHRRSGTSSLLDRIRPFKHEQVASKVFVADELNIAAGLCGYTIFAMKLLITHFKFRDT